jgi:ATP-binding cassette subfamily B protein
VQRSVDKFPVILAKSPNEDGFVCLLIILKYYGKPVENIFTKNLIDDDGISLLQISDAAKSLGLKNLAVQISFERFEIEAPLPAIAHFKQNKFVVVYKITEDAVWVVDPIVGKSQYAKKDFCTYWAIYTTDETPEGVVLLLSKI